MPGGGATPDSVCACSFFNADEVTLDVPSLSFANVAGAVGAPIIFASSIRDGVPTEITREMIDASPAICSVFWGGAGVAKSPATVAPSSSTASFVAATATVAPALVPGPLLRAGAGAGVGAALMGALGLVVEESAIGELRASNVPIGSVHRKAAWGRTLYN